MSDPYADLAGEDEALQARIAYAMDARCLDPAQVELRRGYLEGLELPEGAFAVEFGSGTGHVTRDLVEMAGAARARVKVDRFFGFMSYVSQIARKPGGV